MRARIDNVLKQCNHLSSSIKVTMKSIT